MGSRYITYLRVSTDRQGRSGLGLEAQRRVVMDYLNGGQWEHVAEYVEVESGKKDDRPKLAEALRHCRLTGAILLIAKLDRLTRNARFLFELQESKIKFVAADMPQANDLTVGIMALVAQEERKMISARTKDALAAAKERGVKLGNPRGAQHLAGLGNRAAMEAIRGKARKRAEELLPLVTALRREGVVCIRGLARELNELGVRTPRGRGKWYPTSVARLLKQLML